jgi:RNA polymerase sigma-70 factor (TIGR02960 family)
MADETIERSREGALDRARAGDERAFQSLVEPHRRELRLHCYRILGSLQDAEDASQETLLAAWRGLASFEGRASPRAWLYRIATNRSLNVLRSRRPRHLPEGGPPDPPGPEPTRRDEPLWLEPLPDAWLDGVPDSAPGPEAQYDQREGVALALIAGLLRLPERQRIVLVLRDVLGFRAAEVGEMLETSPSSVDSALRRARSALERSRPERDRELAPLPGSRRERELVERYIAAQARGDVEGAVALLSDDAWLTMPPHPVAYQGRDAIAAFFAAVDTGAEERFRSLPMRANGQPAIAWYLEELGAAVAHPYVLEVLTLAGDQIGATTVFTDPDLFPYFGLPPTLGD